MDSYVSKFVKAYDGLEKKDKNLSSIREILKDIFKDYLACQSVDSSPAVKTKSKVEGTNWSKLWFSADYGGKKCFPKDYAAIKKLLSDSGEKCSHMTVMSKLRTSLESEDGQDRWIEWYTGVQKANKEAPRDPPSERKGHKKTRVVKKSAVSSDDSESSDEKVKKVDEKAKKVEKANKVEKVKKVEKVDESDDDFEL